MLPVIKKIIHAGLKNSLRNELYKVIKPPTRASDKMYERSYSQAGEDRILDYLFDSLRIEKPAYLDIGASHPIICNNTYLFYERGATGVCVEADPSLIDYLAEIRKKDVCLNVGVTFDDRREADFYLFTVAGLNTLSKEEAEFREKNGSHKVEKIVRIPLKNINEIIEENFDEAPDLISIDIEGLDLEVIKSLDFSKHRPLAICMETITYSENRTEKKIAEILDFVVANGYFIYADTHINTIFVEEERFNDPSVPGKPW